MTSWLRREGYASAKWFKKKKKERQRDKVVQVSRDFEELEAGESRSGPKEASDTAEQ